MAGEIEVKKAGTSELDGVMDAIVDAKKFFDEKTAHHIKPLQEEMGRINKEVQRAVAALDILKKELRLQRKIFMRLGLT